MNPPPSAALKVRSATLQLSSFCSGLNRGPGRIEINSFHLGECGVGIGARCQASNTAKMIGMFRDQQSADQGTLCTSATFAHIPRCTRLVHFGVSLWIVLVRSTSRHPGSSGPLHILPMQLEIEPQGRRPGYPSSLPRALRRFVFVR